jgi:two-component system phosphate regulon sensor histidine kinase PhoR
MEICMNSNYTVMVVDDSEDNRDAVSELLEEHALKVVSVSSAAEAIAKCRQNAPDLFVIDVVMPQMSGIELLEQLDVQDNMYEAIVMSGYENLSDARRAMENGALSYIGKPIQSEQLFDHVDRALSFVKIKQQRLKYLSSLENRIKSRTEEIEMALTMLETQSRRLDAIVDSMSDGLVAIDDQDEIVLINRRARQILNLDYSQCVGEKIDTVLQGKPLAEQLGGLLKQMYHEYSEQNNVTLSDTLHNLHHYLIRIAELRYPNSGHGGKIINLVDQTDKVKTEQFRTSFLSVVAHELRTPLTVLTNYISLLHNKERGNGDSAEIIEDMRKTCGDLSLRVKNIIDVANISVSSYPLSTDTCELKAMMEQIMSEFREQIELKNCTPAIESSEPDLTVVTDKKLLRLVINGVISNAIKFNRQDGAVLVRFEQKEKKGKKNIFISIEDQGDGIPQQTKKYLYESFIQGENPLIRKYSGMGTGLYLVRRAIDILNGTIEVFSREGKGTRFVISLPIQE